MSTNAIPGYGGSIWNGGTTAAAYTKVAQVKKWKFGGLKAEFEDITNLDSPAPGGAVYKEWLKVLIDGGSVPFDGVLNPSDPTSQALMVNLAAASANALNYWQLKLSNGTTVFTFQGYVETFDLDNEYNKAVPFTCSVKIVGPVTVVW